MHHFCTYFDSNYLLRGLTLYRSLAATGIDFRLYVLCIDEAAHDAIGALGAENLLPIRLTEIEAWEPRLEQARANRSRIEYYFTLSPVLPLYVLEKWPETDVITYLDADLYFFHSPAALFDELGNGSIAVIEHRFPDYLRDKEKFGRFNVQYESFRRDAEGLACLRRWADDCIDWCYDRLEGERYADQKYLDRWPERYPNLVVLQNPGAGVAPWNWARYRWEHSRDSFRVDGQPLVFYHFHGVKILHDCIISHGLSDFGLMPRRICRPLYHNYIRALRETAAWLAEQGLQPPPLRDRRLRGPSLKSASTLLEILRKVWTQLMWVC